MDASYDASAAFGLVALEGEGGRNRAKCDHSEQNSLPMPAMGGGGGGRWSGGPPMACIPGMKDIMEVGMKGGGMWVGGMGAAARVGGASANSW